MSNDQHFSTGHPPRRYCPTCGRLERVKRDGTMRRHRASVDRGREAWVSLTPCSGSGQLGLDRHPATPAGV